MQNWKIRNKIIFLILMGIFAKILIVIISLRQLDALNQAITTLVDKTIVKTNLVSQIRVALLGSVRQQKNAVLALTDKESEEYAKQSNSLTMTCLAKVSELRVTIDRDRAADEQQAVTDLHSMVKNYEEINKKCLDLAIQNTNLKANDTYVGALRDKMLSITTQLDAMIEKLGEKSGKADGAGSTTRTLRTILALRSLQLRLATDLPKHIATNTTDPAFAQIDREVADLRSQFIKATTEASTSLGPDAAGLRALGEDVAGLAKQVTDYSLQDTNNKSTTLSLKDARDAMDMALASLDRLDGILKTQSDTGRRESNMTYFQGFWIIILFTTAVAAANFVLALSIARLITTPVTMLRDRAHLMATGDLTADITLKQDDEVGELASSTAQLSQSLSKVVSEIQGASGNLGTSAEQLGTISKQLLGQSDAVAGQSSSVASAAEQLSSNISAMAAAAEQMSANFASISTASEEMSVNVSTISSAAEETSANVAIVSKNIGDISASFDTVLDDVREGSRVANQASSMADSATKTIEALNQAGVEISKVTETIKMIALQTNLLALNATIEATSAGEAAKGSLWLLTKSKSSPIKVPRRLRISRVKLKGCRPVPAKLSRSLSAFRT